MFSVPAKTQYGIRALVHLARTETAVAGSGVVHTEAVTTGAEIARSEGISPKYLEGILAQLRTSGLVVAERGKHGGYRLARPAAEIAMIEIVKALEGEIRPVDCIDSASACAQGTDCLPRIFWCGLKGAIDGYLSSRTLRDVIEAD